MGTLHVYWSPRKGGDEPVAKMWVEEDKLKVEAGDEAFSAEIESLLQEMERRKLCSRIVGVDFDQFEFEVAPTYCMPEDAEYLEMLQSVVDGYSLGGGTLTGEVVEG
jgi:hypothetical protein